MVRGPRVPPRRPELGSVRTLAAGVEQPSVADSYGRLPLDQCLTVPRNPVPMASADEEARAFLQTAHLYQLGRLKTEARHPLTSGLSTWAKDDLPRALAALTAIDLQALAALQRSAPAIAALRGQLRA